MVWRLIFWTITQPQWLLNFSENINSFADNSIHLIGSGELTNCFVRIELLPSHATMAHVLLGIFLFLTENKVIQVSSAAATEKHTCRKKCMALLFSWCCTDSGPALLFFPSLPFILFIRSCMPYTLPHSVGRVRRGNNEIKSSSLYVWGGEGRDFFSKSLILHNWKADVQDLCHCPFASEISV